MTSSSEQVMQISSQVPAHRRFLDALGATGLSLGALWMRYFALGRDAGEVEVEAYVSGLISMPPLEHDVLAHAINERLDEIAPPRAPYSESLHEEDG